VLTLEPEPAIRYHPRALRLALAQVAACDVLAVLCAWAVGRPLFNGAGLRQLGGLDVVLFLVALIVTKPETGDASRAAYVKRALSALCVLVAAIILWARLA
jgi:hypothetical protein